MDFCGKKQRWGLLIWQKTEVRATNKTADGMDPVSWEWTPLSVRRAMDHELPLSAHVLERFYLQHATTCTPHTVTEKKLYQI